MKSNTQNSKPFFQRDSFAGILMLLCAAVSLTLSNTSLGAYYQWLWSYSLMGHPVAHWINDGLMAVFFLLIGLELKRELLIGQLRTFERAMLPAVAAIGGMILPAFIYIFINLGLPSQNGFAIPLSTDIAFVIGILALLGDRVPASLKVLLTSLAVVDDLGAILVIALCYTDNLQIPFLIAAGFVTLLLLTFNRLFHINRAWVYGMGGMVLWLLIMESGVHSSITGILLAMAIPFRKGADDAPAALWERGLHKPVYFIILPLFVLANTAISIQESTFSQLWQPHTLGIAAGLLIGKPLGIFLMSWIIIKLGWSQMPEALRWRHILGGGMLCGIGFTMAIFITLLSFETPALVNSAKLTILLASTLAAIAGSLILLTTPKAAPRSKSPCIRA